MSAPDLTQQKKNQANYLNTLRRDCKLFIDLLITASSKNKYKTITHRTIIEINSIINDEIKNAEIIYNQLYNEANNS